MAWLDDGSAVAQTSGLSYAIVDTGQELTYDNVDSLAVEPQAGQPFYGQDAQVHGNQPDYMDNGDGTVTDLVTGLMWQQGYSGKMSQSEAAAAASSFNLAEYTDWRLPTIKELYSLIDFSGEDVDPMSSSANNPFIDTSYFEFEYGDTSAGERIIDSQWATSTLYTGSSNFGQLMFGVNFADGRIKGYPVGTSMGPGGQEKTYFVRYVRGNTSYGQNDFVDSGNGGNGASAVAMAESGESSIPLGTGGTVTDLATGLMWARDDSGFGMSWEDALAYVQDLNDQNYLGYSDWHLPNAKELQSIVDYTRSPDTTNSVAIDPMFNVTSITNEAGELDWAYYWTSTTHASARGGQAAVYIAFGRGLGYMNNQYVDIHGAGCQRSDPKTGSAIPTGRGPQGDVVRVDNLVRVVRNVDTTTGQSSPPETAGNSQATGGASTVACDSGTSFGNEGEEDVGAAYVLFAPLGGQTAYLIDRAGTVVHTWSLSGQPGNSVYLLEGGDLLATYTIDGAFTAGGVGGGVECLAGDGTTIWSFELAAANAQLHHDIEPLPSGNVLLIAWERKTRAEALAAGLSADQLPRSGDVWSEILLEYDPIAGRIVWSWHLWDHRLHAGQIAAEHPEKIDLAYAARQNTGDWFHMNSVDYDEEADHILVSLRHTSEIWIIDHGLSTAQAAGPAGDLLYRYGNPAAYGGTGEQVFYGQHDAGFVTGDSDGVASSSSGTSPSKRILLFDNGDAQERPYSRVVELALPDYENGLFEAAEIVWQYPAEQNDAQAVLFAEQNANQPVLFAGHISGAQRLASGNTLVCVGTEGRFFEVTPSGEIVWEYVNPFTTVVNGNVSNEVFRALAYSSDCIGQSLASSPTPNS